MAASLADEQRLEIGQPNVTGPAIGIHDDRMRTSVIAAVDEKPGGARLPHFPESDFLFTHRYRWSDAYVSAALALRAFHYRREAGQFLSERKKSGTSSDSSLAGKPLSGSGILYVLRSRRAHCIAWR